LKNVTHIPVLTKEVIDLIDPKPNENFIDATFGEGGHSLSILEKNGPNGKVLGIDLNGELIESAKSAIQEKGYTGRATLVTDNFANLKEILSKNDIGPISGILLDLGISSWHLEKSGKGFSFLKDEKLIMRLNSDENGMTAYEILNTWPGEELETIFRLYGEERFSRRITEEIIRERKLKPILKTFHLLEIIKRAVPKYYLNTRIHFATRTFQALRIAVNGELDNIDKALPQALDILEPGGKLVVISFHSLEDRIIKNFFRTEAKKGNLKIITKKPLTPLEEEIRTNPRSRSAKLRAAMKYLAPRG